MCVKIRASHRIIEKRTGSGNKSTYVITQQVQRGPTPRTNGFCSVFHGLSKGAAPQSPARISVCSPMWEAMNRISAQTALETPPTQARRAPAVRPHCVAQLLAVIVALSVKPLRYPEKLCFGKLDSFESHLSRSFDNNM